MNIPLIHNRRLQLCCSGYSCILGPGLLPGRNTSPSCLPGGGRASSPFENPVSGLKNTKIEVAIPPLLSAQLVSVVRLRGITLRVGSCESQVWGLWDLYNPHSAILDRILEGPIHEGDFNPWAQILPTPTHVATPWVEIRPVWRSM